MIAIIFIIIELRSLDCKTFPPTEMLSNEEIAKFKKKPMPREYFSKFTLLADNWKLLEDDNYTIINCLPEGATLLRISDPRYKWFGPYSDEEEVDNNIFRPITNGKLEIIRARIKNGGTYICRITSQTNSDFEVTYSHTFAVFTVPDLLLLRHYYMRSETCLHESQIRWADLAIRTFCRGAQDCDFKIEIDTCLEAAEKEVETRFSVHQKLPSHVHKDMAPNCGTDCKYKILKKSLYETSAGLAEEFHLNLMRAYSRDTDELRYQSRETESSIYSYCPDGYEKFNDQVCVPCDLGAYRALGNESQECTACGIFSYNDRIGQTSCFQCPTMKLTVKYGAYSSSDCIYFFMSWIVMLIVGGILLICVLPLIYCMVIIRIIVKIIVTVLTKMCCSMKQMGPRMTEDGMAEQRKTLMTGATVNPQQARAERTMVDRSEHMADFAQLRAATMRQSQQPGMVPNPMMAYPNR